MLITHPYAIFNPKKLKIKLACVKMTRTRSFRARIKPYSIYFIKNYYKI